MVSVNNLVESQAERSEIPFSRKAHIPAVYHVHSDSMCLNNVKHEMEPTVMCGVQGNSGQKNAVVLSRRNYVAAALLGAS